MSEFNTYRVTLEDSNGNLNTELLISENKRAAVLGALKIQKEDHDFVPIDVMLIDNNYGVKYIKGEE